MASKAVIHASSAIPFKMKQTVLTQEMLRVLLHCSNMIPWERVLGHLNNFTMKMQYSGYYQAFRYAVANSAINAYETIRDRETQGIRPMHRPKNWQRAERIEEKERKKKTWYKQGFDSVLFVPTTPDGKLKKMYEEVIRRSGMRLRVIERTGRTLKSQLQTTNPFKDPNCGRADCFVCSTLGQGNCKTESITYKIEYASPNNCEKGKYKGESSYNGYTRGGEHLDRQK